MAPHPLHLSVTNIIYEKEDKSINIHFKIFKDDLLNAILVKNPKGNYNSNDLYKEIKTVTQYLSDNFKIEIDQKKISLNDFTIIENKNTDDAVLFVYTLKNIKSLKNIKLNNQILFSLFPDQKNMVIFKAGSNEKGCIAEKSEFYCEFQL